MRMIGNEVHIQRGEIWSLDFAVTDKNGHPLALLKDLKHPYLAITVAASLYEQKGDYRETYWLDLDKQYVENEDGSTELLPFKRFTSVEPLYIDDVKTDDDTICTITDVIATYGTAKGGKIVLEEGNDFDVTNFLFFTDPNHDGNYQYRYVKEYTTNASGAVTHEVWEEYDFRIIKQFTTRHWMEQGYFYDIKIVSGQSAQEYVAEILDKFKITYNSEEWGTLEWEEYFALMDAKIEEIVDEVEKEEFIQLRDEAKRLYDDGAPLVAEFDTESIILDPTPIYVSVNLQGGVR